MAFFMAATELTTFPVGLKLPGWDWDLVSFLFELLERDLEELELELEEVKVLM